MKNVNEFSLVNVMTCQEKSEHKTVPQTSIPIEYGIFGVGFQISTDQKLENSTLEFRLLLIG